MYQQNSDEEMLERIPGVTQVRLKNNLTPPLGESLTPSPGALGRDAADTPDEELNVEEHESQKMEMKDLQESTNVQNKGLSQHISEVYSEVNDGENLNKQYW